MNNSKDILIQEDEPLIVLKFQKRRMLWRLFFPYSIGMPILFYLVTIVAFEKKIFEFLFIEVVFGAVFVGGLYSLINMFMIKNIRLYKDKIVQQFRLSKSERVIILNNAKYSSRTAFYHSVMVISKVDRRWKRIVFDPRLISERDKKKFYEILSNVSGRSVAELKNTHPAKKLTK